MRKLVVLLSFALAGTLAGAADTPQPAGSSLAPNLVCELITPVAPAIEAYVVAIEPDGRVTTPVATASSCCDPALEPGTNGNPLCFEGHTCCASGQWQCNNADGTPSCTACGAACGLSGAACSVNADCCSNKCKANHRCR